MNFREITEQDLPAVFEVRVATREHAYSMDELAELGITPESVAEMMKKDHWGYLCEMDERIVGFAMGDRSTGEMWVIAILPDYEGLGIGGKLILLVENWLKDQGCKKLWLTTGSDPGMRAFGFYLHQNWKKAEVEGEIMYFRKSV